MTKIPVYSNSTSASIICADGMSISIECPFRPRSTELLNMLPSEILIFNCPEITSGSVKFLYQNPRLTIPRFASSFIATRYGATSQITILRAANDRIMEDSRPVMFSIIQRDFTNTKVKNFLHALSMNWILNQTPMSHPSYLVRKYTTEDDYRNNAHIYKYLIFPDNAEGPKSRLSVIGHIQFGEEEYEDVRNSGVHDAPEIRTGPEDSDPSEPRTTDRN